MRIKKVCRKLRMKASRQFRAAALRELHAPDRVVAYAEREAKVAAKEADRLARSGFQQATVPDIDIQEDQQGDQP
jgi:predicted nucleic acid-binding protein